MRQDRVPRHQFVLRLVFVALLFPSGGWGNEALSLRADFNGIDDPGVGARNPAQGTGVGPDATIAAGPTTLVLARNSTVAIRDKTGVLIASRAIGDFFAPVLVPGEGFLTDPAVLFDPGSGRFFLVNSARIDNPSCTVGTCVAHILLAVSKTASPMTLGPTDWYFYALDRTLDRTLDETRFTTNWGDFDHLAVVENVVVITSRMYNFAAHAQQGVKIRLLEKAVLVSGSPVTTWIDFVGFGPRTFAGILPAVTFGNPGVVFLVSRSSCGFEVWGISNLFTSPTLMSRTVGTAATCSDPPDAAQPSGGAPLDVAAIGFNGQPVYRNGSLWVADYVSRNFGSGGVSAIRWAQIDVSKWPDSVTIVQDATFGADGIWHFAPSLMVDASNNLALVYARSSTSEFASAYYTGRLATDPLGTLRPGRVLKAGMATLAQIEAGRNRFTDYFGTALDPSDGSIWMLGMYVTGSDTSGTWVGNSLFDAGAPLVAAVLPSSRSVQVGTPATAFATLINAGQTRVFGCSLTPLLSLMATFTYQTTDPATNLVTSTPNTPVDIPAGRAQSFVFAVTATSPILPTDVQLSFDCLNTNPASINSGLNTLLLSVSAGPIPDIVALAATLTNDGIANISGPSGTGVLAVATVNVGAGGSITASVDTGPAVLPVTIAICQTDPGTGACLAAPSSSVTTVINAGATPTFGVFVTGTGPVAFDPAANRVFVRFKDEGTVTRGSTSVAVRTQ